MSNSGPRAKCDQVVYEAIAKACEIVVSSRGNNNGTSAQPSPHSSSRFNLQLPEIQAVRSILQTYRLSLHVPIRLDVYYQHHSSQESSGTAQGSRRELLERWCLEYRPAPTERFLQAEGIVTQDPIVQLRHVCKRIVVWLRTLYCWTRLLPAQGFSSSNTSTKKPPIGFSVYVNTNKDDDDVTDLTQNQGFRWQGQPSPVVTPYGELGWKVFYSPALDRLFALHRQQLQHPQRFPSATVARPIPQQQNHQYPPRHQQQQGQIVPQSAPAHMMRHLAPARSQSSRGRFVEPFSQNTAAAQPKAPPPQQHTYHAPSRLLMPRSQSAREDSFGTSQEQSGMTTALPPPSVLRRRHTSIGQEEHEKGDSDDGDAPPERVMSGLSLALMAQQQETKSTDNEDPSSAEKRHAALHELPPHLAPPAHNSNNNKSAPPSAAEYGYAYNSHIPWQRIHPSSNHPVVGRSSSSLDNNDNNSNRNLTSSPLLPPPALAGTTPPPSGGFLGADTTPPNQRSLCTTPPFPNRPAGFIQEAPRAQFLPPPPPKQQQQQHPTPAASANVASLDLLHSSPFQQPQQQQPASSSSSLLSSAAASPLERVWSSSSPGSPLRVDDSHYYEPSAEEMPFAVDIMSSSASAQQQQSSSLIASFAQKCAPQHHRLKLFESSATTTEEPTPQQAEKDNAMVGSLVEQLAEFHTFGASMQQPSAPPLSGSDSAASASSTPISLRS